MTLRSRGGCCESSCELGVERRRCPEMCDIFGPARMAASKRCSSENALKRRKKHGGFFGLVQPQVRPMFPRMYRAAVAFVLLEFGVAKRVIDVVAERGADNRIVVELNNGLA